MGEIQDMNAEINAVIASMTPVIYQRLLTAVETGKWPDGTTLTPEQRKYSLQLTILWQTQHDEKSQYMKRDQNGNLVIDSPRDDTAAQDLSDLPMNLEWQS